MRTAPNLNTPRRESGYPRYLQNMFLQIYLSTMKIKKASQERGLKLSGFLLEANVSEL